MEVKKYIITEAEYEAAKEASRENQNKQIDKRLQVIIMRYEGKKDREIAGKLDFHRKSISQLCASFKQNGLEEYTKRKYGGNHRNMTKEEEKAFLAGFEEAALSGQLITIADIAAAYDEATGKKHESNSTVYYLLHKHKWRLIIPQRVHPGKASDEAIEASKKLTLK
jgi:transposase